MTTVAIKILNHIFYKRRHRTTCLLIGVAMLLVASEFILIVRYSPVPRGSFIYFLNSYSNLYALSAVLFIMVGGYLVLSGLNHILYEHKLMTVTDEGIIFYITGPFEVPLMLSWEHICSISVGHASFSSLKVGRGWECLKIEVGTDNAHLLPAYRWSAFWGVSLVRGEKIFINGAVFLEPLGKIRDNLIRQLELFRPKGQ
jgi:hypothetical protein